MKYSVPSFIVGMSAGAILAEGNGLVITMISAVAFGILNVYCERHGRLRRHLANNSPVKTRN